MKVRLEQIDDEPFRWQESLSVAVGELDRYELIGLSELACQGEIRRLEEGFLLRATLEYDQTLRCNRCLAEIAEPVRSELDLILDCRPVGAGAEEVELGDDDFSVLHVEKEVLDTRPLLVEQVQLNIPMKPLCDPQCRGLCPQCGADLNRAACGCAPALSDPRWAALEGLRDRLQ